MGYQSVPRGPRAEAPLPVWLSATLWIGAWAIATPVLWLVGRLKESPDSWTASAILAGLLVVGSAFVQRVKRKRQSNAR